MRAPSMLSILTTLVLVVGCQPHRICRTEPPWRKITAGYALVGEKFRGLNRLPCICQPPALSNVIGSGTTMFSSVRFSGIESVS